MNVKVFILDKRIQLVFTLFGAIGGFLYWDFIGCESGTCAIKSVWYWSTLWGAVFGYLIGDFVVDVIKKIKKKKEGKDEREV